MTVRWEVEEELGIQREGFAHRRGEKQTEAVRETVDGDRAKKMRGIKGGRMTPFSCTPRKINTMAWKREKNTIKRHTAREMKD